MNKRSCQTLTKLYAAMAAHTAPECGKTCGTRTQYRCCDPMYCEMAIEWAKDRYGVTLEPTGHHSLPLMGADGCSVAPHYRPLCTLHQCDIGALGFLKSDPMGPWTKRYFALRDKINDAEAKASEEATE